MQTQNIPAMSVTGELNLTLVIPDRFSGEEPFDCRSGQACFSGGSS